MATAAICMMGLTACASVPASHKFISKEASVSKITKTQAALRELSAPSSKVTVAVYEFEDKTGQFKPTEAGQTLSRAVSQGGDELLVKALHDAGNRSWFTVIERSNLNNLLKERQIITEMRSRYLGETQVNSKALPPLLFAGVILEGGIIGFDTNTLTGGAAARYLGIGGQTDYRQNVVTVHLRAVSVKTGEVLTSVTTEKTIASVGVSANAFKFVSFNELLEIDTGITSNEPGLMALRQAIEKAVYALVIEGADIGLWAFDDRTQQAQYIHQYKYERDGVYPETAQNQFAQKAPTSTAIAAIDVNKRAPKAKPIKVSEATAPAPSKAPSPVVVKPVAVAKAPVKRVQAQPQPRQVAPAKPRVAQAPKPTKVTYILPKPTSPVVETTMKPVQQNQEQSNSQSEEGLTARSRSYLALQDVFRNGYAPSPITSVSP